MMSRGAVRWISADLLAQFAAEGTDAHRLGSAPDCWVERFGRDLLVSYQNDAGDVLTELPGWMKAHQLPLDRIFLKHLPRQNAERAAPLLHTGDPTLGLTTWVRERDVEFGIDFAAGYSAGLFIDQRANRAFVAGRRPRQVLNCFAYTCAFSVVGALAGATTTSIDLSKKSLTRGQANFTRNGLPLAPHQFLADDVLAVLPRLVRRGTKFDLVILDPPTFSRGHQGRKFQVEHDFEALIAQALELTGPGGAILLSTNCTRLPRAALERMARFCLRTSRRGGDLLPIHAPPDVPEAAAPRTLWLLPRG